MKTWKYTSAQGNEYEIAVDDQWKWTVEAAEVEDDNFAAVLAEDLNYTTSEYTPADGELEPFVLWNFIEGWGGELDKGVPVAEPVKKDRVY